MGMADGWAGLVGWRLEWITIYHRMMEGKNCRGAEVRVDDAGHCLKYLTCWMLSNVIQSFIL